MQRGLPSAILSAFLLTQAAPADTFKLKSGETFEGEVLLDKGEKVWVRTFAGAKWISRAELAEISPSPSPWQRYEQVKKAFPVTAVGQFELAMWCGANNLIDEREKHLRLAVGLEPNYEPACVALGYVKQGDRWIAPKKESLDMPRRPTLPGAGPAPVTTEKPETPQKPGVAEKTAAGRREEEADRRARNVWSHGIFQIYNNLLTRKNAEAQQEGIRQILAITEPQAVDGIIENLAHRTDSLIRRLCARALGGFRADRALVQLIVMALTDSDPEVAEEACRSLRALNDPRTGALVRKGLEGPEDLLENSAKALAALGDFDSVPALIAVLSGRQRLGSDSDPDGIAAYFRQLHKSVPNCPVSFEPGALLITDDVKAQLGGGRGPSGRRHKQPTVNKMRTVVQEALVRIANGKDNFGIDAAGWKAWYNRKAAERAGAAGGAAAKAG